MPHRDQLLHLLENYAPKNPTEAGEVHIFKHFVHENTDCFERSNLVGHVTASGWIVSKDMNHVLLHMHKKANRWMQFGGHNDGDNDVLNVATKENEEETGLTSVQLLSDTPLDIGVRFVEQHKDIPAHVHFDVCFIFSADMNEPFNVDAGESTLLKWFSLKDAKEAIDLNDTSCHRFLTNTQSLKKA